MPSAGCASCLPRWPERHIVAPGTERGQTCARDRLGKDPRHGESYVLAVTPAATQRRSTDGDCNIQTDYGRHAGARRARARRLRRQQQLQQLDSRQQLDAGQQRASEHQLAGHELHTGASPQINQHERQQRRRAVQPGLRQRLGVGIRRVAERVGLLVGIEPLIGSWLLRHPPEQRRRPGLRQQWWPKRWGRQRLDAAGSGWCWRWRRSPGPVAAPAARPVPATPRQHQDLPGFAPQGRRATGDHCAPPTGRC